MRFTHMISIGKPRRVIYWVAGPLNQEKPLRLHNIHEAVRMADLINGQVFTRVGGSLVLVYSCEESKFTFN